MKFVIKTLKRIGFFLISLSNKIEVFLKKQKKIEFNIELNRGLYKTQDNLLLWLGNDSVIDKNIISGGCWEPDTTKLVKSIIKEGMHVFDVGANIGYFTTLFSKLTGNNGVVFAFEPTVSYKRILEENIKINKLKNIQVYNFGLSNLEQELDINIDASSATIHQPFENEILSKETINLKTLDNFVFQSNIKKIDFIKVDIDGHEPFFLEGAIQSIQKFKSILLIEISHLHYLEAGVNAWDFYDKLKTFGFKIYSEVDLLEISNKRDFLIKCGNFAYSTNILLSLEHLNKI
jgi:FkbM family methyltransferase